MGIVVKKFKKNNKPITESSTNVNESLGFNTGVRANIIIKKDLNEDEFQKEVITYMKSKNKILDKRDIEYLLSNYIECENRSVMDKIIKFITDMMHSFTTAFGSDLGEIKSESEYAIIIDTAMSRYLGANMYPFVKFLATYLVITGVTVILTVILTVIFGFIVILFFVPGLVFVEVVLNLTNIVTYLKNIKKTRLILLDTCYQIDGTILAMRKEGGDEVEIEALENIKKRIMKYNLITQKGLDRYTKKQLGIIESINEINKIYGFEGQEKVQRRIQDLKVINHLNLIEDYMEMDFGNFDDNFSVDNSEDVPSYKICN